MNLYRNNRKPLAINLATFIVRSSCLSFLFLILILNLILVVPRPIFAEGVQNLSPSAKGGDNGCSFSKNGGKYCVLSPIKPFINETINVGGEGGFSNYLNTIYKLGIAVCTGLAVIMIVMGGLRYVSSAAIGGKGDGKTMIQDALWGLLLALTSYLLLNTINPALLKSDLKITATPNVGTIQASQADLLKGDLNGTSDVGQEGGVEGGKGGAEGGKGGSNPGLKNVPDGGTGQSSGKQNQNSDTPSSGTPNPNSQPGGLNLPTQQPTGPSNALFGFNPTGNFTLEGKSNFDPNSSAAAMQAKTSSLRSERNALLVKMTSTGFTAQQKAEMQKKVNQISTQIQLLGGN
jgi:hypothetical protein